MVEFIDTDQSVYEKKIKELEYLVLNQNKKNQFAYFTNYLGFGLAVMVLC